MAAEKTEPNAPDALGVLGLGLLGLFLLSYPWFAPALQARYALGMPLANLYVMAVWLLLTGLVGAGWGDD
jgi:hypothetical protein